MEIQKRQAYAGTLYERLKRSFIMDKGFFDYDDRDLKVFISDDMAMNLDGNLMMLLVFG